MSNIIKKIELDNCKYSVKEFVDELPIFLREDGYRIAPTFDEEEDVMYWTLLVETENNLWMDKYIELGGFETDRTLNSEELELMDRWSRLCNSKLNSKTNKIL